MPLLQDKLVAYLTPAKALRQLLARPGFTQRRIEPVDIRLNLLATPLVDDLAPHDLADIGHAVASRGQLALDVVDAFAEHHVDPFRPLVQDHDFDGWTAFGAHLDLLVVHESQFSMKRLSSGVVSARSRSPKLPFSLTSRAASSRPLIAARYSELARLIRRTPAAWSSATLKDLPLMPAMKLTGLDTAAHTARTAARSGRPGAISTSAPAFSNACKRLIVSCRSGLPRKKFSVRAVKVNAKGSARAARAAAATRSVACSRS